MALKLEAGYKVDTLDTHTICEDEEQPLGMKGGQN